MYNPERKVRFLRQNTHDNLSPAITERLFDRLGQFEVRVGKDLAEMTPEEYQEVLDNLETTRIAGMPQILPTLRKYLRWCGEQPDIPDPDPRLRKVRSLGLSAKVTEARSRLVASPQELRDFLAEFTNPPELNTVDSLLCCYYWLAFSGLPSDAYTKVTETMVKINRMQIIFEGISYPIYPEALEHFKRAKTTREFFIPRADRPRGALKKRTEGNLLLRGTGKKVQSLMFATSLRQKIEAKPDSPYAYKRVTYDAVRDSGYFYRAYELEHEEHIEPNFVVMARNYVHSDNDAVVVRSVLKNKAMVLEQEYYAWKDAFELD